MTKKLHSQLPEKTRASVVDFLLAAYQQRFSMGNELTQFLFKALITANLGGIGVTVSFGVSFLQQTISLDQLFWPSLLFLVGTVAASVSAFVYSVVAIEGAEHVAKSVEDFLREKVHFEDMTGYALTSKGRRIIFFSALVAATTWIAGVGALFLSLGMV